MICSCNKKMLRIPYGNDFRLGICRYNVVPGSPEDVTFADVSDLTVKIVSKLGWRTTMNYTITEGGDLIIDIPNTSVRRTIYGIEMTGTYGGHKWRWKANNVFQIVDTNDASTVQGYETFDEDAYWIDDVFSADIIDNDVNGQTLELITHGQATMDGGELTITASGVELSADGEELIITLNT